ncbi:hypothetical protein ACFLSS_03445 [Bacteroidota bacterium]
MKNSVELVEKCLIDASLLAETGKTFYFMLILHTMICLINVKTKIDVAIITVGAYVPCRKNHCNPEVVLSK